MVRDAALRGAFMHLFAALCGMWRVRVRPDCHQNSHQNHRYELCYRRAPIGPQLRGYCGEITGETLLGPSALGPS